MNELQKVFEYQGSNVRTIVKDGEPWFVAKDIAEILGYANPQKAVRDHCRKAQAIGMNESFTLDPQTIIIPEQDMYRLIMKSKLPSAEIFEAWVVEQVLPSIRKTGSYDMSPKLPQTYAEALRMLADSVEVVEAQKKALTEAAPKVEAFDHFIDGVNCKSVARVAQEIGTGQNTLYAFLRNLEYLFSGGERHNNPYQTYIDRGLFTVKTTPVKMGDKFVNVSQTLITPKGEAHVAELWREQYKEAA